MNTREYQRKYYREYYRKNRKKCLKWFHKNKHSPNRIWTRLKENGRVDKRRISKEDFVKWYNEQERECIYCGIKEKELRDDFLIKNKRSTRLQIDRIDNNKSYENGNLALACKWCNETKSDIFTFEEMKIIGEIIRKKREEINLLVKK